jgi:hypothetical protein
VSEQAPERTAPPQAPPPGKKENVFTRKIGPLPMWVWLAIIALVILLYVMFFSKKKKGGGTGQGQGQQQGFGAFLVPPIIQRIGGGGGGPPHTHHHRRGDHDDDDDDDKKKAKAHDQMRAARSAGAAGPGPGPAHDVPVGIDRRDKRGQPVPGFLVQFKTAEQGQTPSLQDVANHYDTAPEAIVQEAEGRGYPNSVAWKRYVSRHDWASPLPPATDFSILAHPAL